MSDTSTGDGREENILAASEMLRSWVAPVLIVGVIITAFIGAIIGRRIVKKHLVSDAKTT